MILDTEFIISLTEQNQGALRKAQILEAADIPLRIPAVVIYELYISVGKTAKRKYKIKDQRAYERLLNSKPIVEVNDSIAKRAGVLEGTHQRSDSRPNLGAIDALVAATAQFFNEPIVSSDRDFNGIDGVRVESY